MRDLEMVFSDDEIAEIHKKAEEMGISVEEAGAQFMRLHMMRIANAQSLPEPAVVIPIRSGRKRPGK